MHSKDQCVSILCVFSLYRVQGKGDAQTWEVSETLVPATLGPTGE